MNREIQQRLVWVKLFEETNDAGLVCRRCGISRPTLRKWWKRYSEQGIDGLSSQSKRPLKSPNTKINAELEALISLIGLVFFCIVANNETVNKTVFTQNYLHPHAMIPPSPLLSARIMTITYLRETINIMVEKISDKIPNILISLIGIPCVS